HPGSTLFPYTTLFRSTADADCREAVALEVDVGPGVLVYHDERNRRQLREPIGFLHRDRRPPAPGIGIFRVLVVLPAPVTPDPERDRKSTRLNSSHDQN